MTLKEQYKIFREQKEASKRHPLKPSTLINYDCYWRVWINPFMGSKPVSDVENGIMKRFVAHLVAANLSASSIAGITQLIKGIVSSAVDENGNEMFPRKWNADFIDAPVIDPKAQDAPVIGAAEVASAIAATPSQYGTLFALLAGSGLRVGEALALRMGPNPESSYWDPRQSKFVIRKTIFRGQEQAPKTAAGEREVDIPLALNDYLIARIAGKSAGDLLFANANGRPLRPSSLYEAGEAAGVPGFHSFRRFRITHLENAEVPRGLAMYWTGHAGKDVHDRYVKLDRDIAARKIWVEKAGLGFDLPTDRNPDLPVAQAMAVSVPS